MGYKYEFPDFDGELPVIEGFVDDSWHNDVCPSMFNKRTNIKLWVDYVDPDKREGREKRYCVSRLEDDGSLTQILETDDISTIVFLWGISMTDKQKEILGSIILAVMVFGITFWIVDILSN